MEQRFLLKYFPSTWFIYENKYGIYYCQTDGLLFQRDEKKLTIIECKYQHTADAYFQLEELYVPVVSCAFPRYTVATVEVVSWYDAAVRFPTAIKLRKDVVDVAPGEFAVHIFN